MTELRWIHVSGPLADGVVCEQGAHVCDWTPADHAPVLFLAGESRMEPGQPIRGGVPIVYPWFGDDPDARGRPAHGFARRVPWRVLEVAEADTGVRTALELVDDDATRALWPHRFALRLDAHFGATLALSLRVANRGDAPFRCEAALHTYLAVGDIREVALLGLGGAPYLDKVGGGHHTQVEDRLTFAGETDRVYTDTAATVRVDDPVLDRVLTVAKRGSRSTVVWNPWIVKAARLADLGDDEWIGMLCVETANVGDDAVTLAPGDEHVLAVELSVGPRDA